LLRPEIPAEARNAALLALGSAAFRRAELVGLDWQKRGDGTGKLKVFVGHLFDVEVDEL
jgi:hypothetical protein